MLLQRRQLWNIFEPSPSSPLTTIMREFHVLLNYPDFTVKNMACPKNVWMWYCSETDWEGASKFFKKRKGRGRIKEGGIV